MEATAVPIINAFVARSFHPSDEMKIQPLLKCLDSFRKMGFLWQTAEPAEVESVSKQVRDMIEKCEVFVGIFTRRFPFYKIERNLATAFAVLRGNVEVQLWTAPPWVIQESGFAIRADRKLILLRERGVDFPALQGDLEYIDFEEGNFAPAFQRVSEMVNGILAKATGTVVETVLQVAAPAAERAATVEADKLEGSLPKEQSHVDYFGKMAEAIAQGNWGDAEKAHNEGLEYLTKEKPGITLLWTATYQKFLFFKGQADALLALLALADENPKSPEPLEALAQCYEQYKNHEKAIEYFLKAADLDPKNRGQRLRISAARCARTARQIEFSIERLLNVLVDQGAASAELRIEALRELHLSLKESGDFFAAGAVGEVLLHENPGISDFRFSLGLHYEKCDFNGLFLQHYSLLCDRDSSNSAALHNLGLAYSECELPLLSVSKYKEAFNLGETLSANNLGYKYLDAGMAEEATEILERALSMPNAESAVAGAFAQVHERKQQESKKEKSTLESAEKLRQFMVSFGHGFLAKQAPELDGVWKFPFAEITLKVEGKKLTGEGQSEILSPRSLFGNIGLFGTESKEAAKEIQKYKVSGSLLGRTCAYRVETELPFRPTLSSLTGTDESSKEGIIVFAADGLTGEAVTTKDGSPKTRFKILRES